MNVERQIHPPEKLQTWKVAAVESGHSDRWLNGLTEHALRFALRISDDITAVHVTSEKPDDALIETWRKHIEEPARAAGYSKFHLEVIHSPYRTLFQPILDYIKSVQAKEPERLIAVTFPN